MSALSLTLPRPYGRGPLPLPQAGEGLSETGALGKMCASTSAKAGVHGRWIPAFAGMTKRAAISFERLTF